MSCPGQLKSMSFIWIWAFVIHGGFWVKGGRRLAKLVCADVHFFSSTMGEIRTGRRVKSGGWVKICLGNAQKDDALLTLGLPSSLAIKMPSALLIVLGPVFNFNNSQYLIYVARGSAIIQ